MKSWSTQLDELVEVGSYADAIALLATLDQAVLPDKVGPTLLQSMLYTRAKETTGT